MRISSPAANSTTSPRSRTVTAIGRSARSRISIHSRSASQQRDVGERVDLQVRVQLAVEHVEDVAVELGRHPRGVVVRGHQHGRVRDQRRTEQQVLTLPQRGPHPGEERGPLRRFEVADRAAQEGDEPPIRGRAGPGVVLAGQPVQVGGEVAHHAVQHQCRVAHGQRVERLTQRGHADVERDVAAQRPGAGEGVEQQPRLRRRPRPELDQRGRPRQRGDLVDVRGEQRRLGARREVLGQRGDLLEQRAAARVVEVLRRQLFRARCQSEQHVRAAGRRGRRPG